MAFLGEILILLRHQGPVFLSAARSKGWILLGAALSQCCWCRNGQQGLTGGIFSWAKLGGKLSSALTPRASVEPVGGQQSRRGRPAFTSACLGVCEQKKWSQNSARPNTSLPLTAGFTLHPQYGIRLILEAYFKVWRVFSNTISSYNLEMAFSFILINLLNKYANISSALYKNTYTQHTTPHNKSKINKNMYCLTHMKWPSSFETIMKQLHIGHRT